MKYLLMIERWNAMQSRTSAGFGRGTDGFQIRASGDRGVIVAGSAVTNSPATITEWTSWDPQSAEGDFPIYNPNDLYYTENNVANGVRSFIMHFDSQLNLEWSTLYGNVSTNYTHCASAEGAYTFIGGHASINGSESASQMPWTLQDFNEATPAGSVPDYYVNYVTSPTETGWSNQQATIARFILPTVVGVSEHESPFQEKWILIFPNPAADGFSIQLSESFSIAAGITVTDASGRIVYITSLEPSEKRKEINCELFSSGLYVVSVNCNGQIARAKLLKH